MLVLEELRKAVSRRSRQLKREICLDIDHSAIGGAGGVGQMNTPEAVSQKTVALRQNTTASGAPVEKGEAPPCGRASYLLDPCGRRQRLFSRGRIREACLSQLAWIQWQRRILVRWEYHTQNFLGFVQLACLVTALSMDHV
jgi:hypothetical protein